MTEEQRSYRQIFKATSLFGGVQIFSIIITIIRSKFVAVLLGPAGMGINGLLSSTTGLIGGLTNFGLGTSAVKNVAAVHATGDNHRVGIVVGVLRRLVWITGSLGAFVTIILSPWLSQLTFGNRDYTLAFIWISITLLLNQISTGQGVILRSTRQLKYMARSSLLGSVFGLVISVPIYYFFGIDGIVPAIIVSSVTSLALTWYFSAKVKIDKVKISKETTIREGNDMLTMGFMLSVSGLITLAASYLIRIFISNTGGVEDVGLYSAGFAIISTYVGLVFTAMGTDYYPRLSGVAHDNRQAISLINQQAEVAILILAPILTVFLIFINWVVILLYSTKFTSINEMIHWAALGMYFKAVSWSIAFILLAKGASNLFFWNELIANIYFLGFNVLGYKLAGLEGLGISFLVVYFIYFIQILLVTKFKYSFSFNEVFYKVAGFQFLLGLLCFGIMKTLSSPWTFILGSVLIIISTLYSLIELENRIGLKEIIISRLNNLKSK